MRDPGRVSAAIAILEDFDRRRVPLKTAIADWARNARFAGAKDRAWISGLCLDVLRRRASLSAAMQNDAPRGATLAALRLLWGRSVDDIAALAAETPHGPGALGEEERARLAAMSDENLPIGGLSTLGDFPPFLEDAVRRAFGENAIEEMRALAARADVDLRINTLEATIDKAREATASVDAEPHPFVETALRIKARDASDRAPTVTVIPAFNKGWVEVQDLGSQIAALAAGAVRGAQVLDLCAGGGGKTLALAALMENSGQLYAYDNDARRLQPLYERARRAGARNLQIVNPVTDGEALNALAGKIDVVFVDAPCTGAGTWRRHPDTKWRLREDQLARRMAEQDGVLAEAARFVKPGGRIVYVTCSFLMEENEDRLSAFLAAHRDFRMTRALAAIEASGRLTRAGAQALARCETGIGEAGEGALRLSPLRTGTDGFFVATLQRG